MTKAELLAFLGARVIRVIQVEEKPDQVKNDAGIRTYIVNVLRQTAQGNTEGKNIGFYTVDEGQPEEQAYFNVPGDVPPDPALVTIAKTYIGTIRTQYETLKVIDINQEDEVIAVEATRKPLLDDGATLERKVLYVYLDQDGNPTHREVTT